MWEACVLGHKKNRYSERRNLVELWFSLPMRVFTDTLKILKLVKLVFTDTLKLVFTDTRLHAGSLCSQTQEKQVF